MWQNKEIPEDCDVLLSLRKTDGRYGPILPGLRRTLADGLCAGAVARTANPAALSADDCGSLLGLCPALRLGPLAGAYRRGACAVPLRRHGNAGLLCSVDHHSRCTLRTA